MRVPDEIRDCVCFLETWRESRTGRGTAFLVGLEDDRLQGFIFSYVVTARHCLYDLIGKADEIRLRFNGQSGGIGVVKTSGNDWLEHPNSDVAVLPFLPDQKQFQYKVYPLVSCASEDVVEDKLIGAGDDVFLTGMLVFHPGQTRIMPIVRLGNIAAMPDEPVRLQLGKHQDAAKVSDRVALLETRSIGGLSGSPVFVHLPFWRDIERAGMQLVSTGSQRGSSGGQHYLLGVMHGFYPVGENDPDGISGQELNTGIGVVARIDRVLDLINGPEETKKRNKAIDRHLDKQMPTPTAAEGDHCELQKFEERAGKLMAVPEEAEEHDPSPSE